MKRFFTATSLFLALAAPALAGTTTTPWEIDPVHSTAQFSVRHMMISNVKGEFTKLNGVAYLDDQNLAASTVEVTIDTSSINTREPKRNAHLKSADFFDVAHCPVMTFKSKQITATGNGRLKMTGDLTIRGVTREVAFDVERPTPPVKDPAGNLRVGASATAQINRKDFGLTWNAALETGGVLVGDEVGITIEVEFVKKPAPAAGASAGRAN